MQWCEFCVRCAVLASLGAIPLVHESRAADSELQKIRAAWEYQADAVATADVDISMIRGGKSSLNELTRDDFIALVKESENQDPKSKFIYLAEKCLKASVFDRDPKRAPWATTKVYFDTNRFRTDHSYGSGERDIRIFDGTTHVATRNAGKQITLAPTSRTVPVSLKLRDLVLWPKANNGWEVAEEWEDRVREDSLIVKDAKGTFVEMLPESYEVVFYADQSRSGKTNSLCYQSNFGQHAANVLFPAISCRAVFLSENQSMLTLSLIYSSDGQFNQTIEDSVFWLPAEPGMTILDERGPKEHVYVVPKDSVIKNVVEFADEVSVNGVPSQRDNMAVAPKSDFRRSAIIITAAIVVILCVLIMLRNRSTSSSS